MKKEDVISRIENEFNIKVEQAFTHDFLNGGDYVLVEDINKTSHIFKYDENNDKFVEIPIENKDSISYIYPGDGLLSGDSKFIRGKKKETNETVLYILKNNKLIMVDIDLPNNYTITDIYGGLIDGKSDFAIIEAKNKTRLRSYIMKYNKDTNFLENKSPNGTEGYKIFMANDFLDGRGNLVVLKDELQDAYGIFGYDKEKDKLILKSKWYFNIDINTNQDIIGKGGVFIRATDNYRKKFRVLYYDDKSDNIIELPYINNVDSFFHLFKTLQDYVFHAMKNVCN